MPKKKQRADFSFAPFFNEFLLFGLKQVRSCIFAGVFFALLFLSHFIPLFGMARYDFLFLAALMVQAILVISRLETLDELKVIFLFHLIGLGLELFKTSPQIGSWSYPEPGLFKIATVPLYSGFMYAAVASYMIQAWRQFDLQLQKYPSFFLTVPLIVIIYANFFTKHFFIPDLRWWIIAAVVLLFGQTTVWFTVQKKRRSMPLVLSFFLIGFFIWVAENISTFFGAWKYPDQHLGWHIVSFEKISSWFLLIIISFFIVANLRMLKERK
jgi:uncharacterized membrane protein YoaT (DUF817 family)